MPVVLVAIGGGAVALVGAADSYANYSAWSEYSDWGEYSDAAERQKRRIEAKKEETEHIAKTLSNYKKDTINPQLSDPDLIAQTVMKVSTDAMDLDAKEKISEAVKENIERTAQSELQQITQINELLSKIDQIEEEERRT